MKKTLTYKINGVDNLDFYIDGEYFTSIGFMLNYNNDKIIVVTANKDDVEKVI